MRHRLLRTSPPAHGTRTAPGSRAGNHADRPAVPDGLPVLSPGRHLDPSEGGCLMEWTSLLAGEAWTDHPACTHPLLAHLARCVNDLVGDHARTRLAVLVPDLVGTRSDDLRWDLEIALVAVRHALAAADDSDARTLAAAVLTLDRLLAALDGRAADATAADGEAAAGLPAAHQAERRPATAAVLGSVPVATAWAEAFTARMGRPRANRTMTRSAVDLALRVVVETGRPDRFGALVAMLVEAVSTCRALLPGVPHQAAGRGAERPARVAPRVVVG